MINDRAIRTVTLLDAADFASSDVKTVIVDLGSYACSEGRFAVQAKAVSVASSGKVDISMAVSIDSVNYFAPTTAVVIADVGAAAKQANILPHAPTYVRYVKFTFTEDTGTGSVTGLTATMLLQ